MLETPVSWDNQRSYIFGANTNSVCTSWRISGVSTCLSLCLFLLVRDPQLQKYIVW